MKFSLSQWISLKTLSLNTIFKGKFLFSLFFLISYQFAFTQEKAVMYLTGDAQITGLDMSIEIIRITPKNVSKSTSQLVVQKTIPKKQALKSIEKKQKAIKLNHAPTKFYTNTTSGNGFVSNGTKDHKSFIRETKSFSRFELVFHFKELNIPIFIHLEKIYKVEYAISSEISRSFFSRPPPPSVS